MGPLVFVLFVFFFKQKTAYEIKECDWSSDVCSSDLIHTVTDLVERYAPAGVVSEDSYAGFISEVVGVGRTERIDIIALMPLIMRAMIWFENGQNPYPWWAINNAVEDIVSGGPKQGNP